MIDTDVVGQKKLDEILESLDSFDWNAWEMEYLQNLKRHYARLTPKQKSMVGRMYDQLMEGS